MTPRDLHTLNLSVIACDVNKKPLTKWKANQTHITIPDESTHYGIVCGAVSGNLECIDYDLKNDATQGATWIEYKNIIEATRPYLFERLILERSVNGGVHVVYRCVTPIDKNLVLAKAEDGATAFFETRGEGGYYICAGSVGYELIQGTYDAIPILTTDERELLIAAARALNLYSTPDKKVERRTRQQQQQFADAGSVSPLDDYDARGDVLTVLTQHGWTVCYTTSIHGRTVTYLTRPNKARGVSASFNYIDNRLHVFTSNAAPLDAGTYKPCAVLAYLQHGGDFRQTAIALVNDGYGTQRNDAPAFDSAVSHETNDDDEGKPRHEFVIDCLYKNQYGDALLYAHTARGKILYDHALSQWYFFGRGEQPHWRRDTTKEINNDIVSVLVSIYRRALQRERLIESQAVDAFNATVNSERTQSEVERKRAEKATANCDALRRRVQSLYDWKRTPAVLNFVSTLLGSDGLQWDSDTMLLGVANGVCDLQHGTLRDVRPDDFIRSVAPTHFVQQATCQRYMKFLDEIFAGDKILIDFIQKLLGYSITGASSEHIHPILWGEHGRNGKDTLVYVLQNILGSSLAKSIHPEAIIQSRKNSGAPSEELYDLWGVRVAWVNESEESARIKPSQLKLLSGGSLIKCHPKYGHMVEFKPTHLLMLITNHKPIIPADDQAIWERLCLIPFTESFIDNPTTEHQHHVDKHLIDKLRVESEGILQWLIAGCLRWQYEGLKIPDALKQSTREYRLELDTVTMWIDAQCQRGVLLAISGADAYQNYSQWCAKEGYYALGRKTLSQALLQQSDVTPVNNSANVRGRGWRGFALAPDAERFEHIARPRQYRT